MFQFPFFNSTQKHSWQLFDTQSIRLFIHKHKECTC